MSAMMTVIQRPSKDKLKWIKLMIENDADIWHHDEKGLSVVHFICNGGYYEILLYIYQHLTKICMNQDTLKIKLNEFMNSNRNEKGYTPYHFACKNGDNKIGGNVQPLASTGLQQ